MTRQRAKQPKPKADEVEADASEVVEEPDYPSAEERKGMRGHDDQGNVRPADGRWALHKPQHESKVTATKVKSD